MITATRARFFGSIIGLGSEWVERDKVRVHLDDAVVDEVRIDAARAQALAAAASDCRAAIRVCDLRAFGDAVRRSFHAQVAMFPRMMNDHIRTAIDRYRAWRPAGHCLAQAAAGT